jgi:hypothetical protein
MKFVKIVAEILPVIGTIGLFSLWLFQQTEIEKRTADLQKISWAKGVYKTYQSNNAIFNALIELAPKQKNKEYKIRQFQMYNYELGLNAMEDVLTENEKSDLPEAQNPYIDLHETNLESFMANVQKRLETLQSKIAEKEKAIQEASEKLQRKYFIAYILFSVVSILGAILIIIDKLK